MNSIKSLYDVSSIILSSSIALIALAPITITYIKTKKDYLMFGLDDLQNKYNLIKYLILLIFMSTISSTIVSAFYLFETCYGAYVYNILLLLTIMSLIIIFIVVSILVYFLINMLKH